MSSENGQNIKLTVFGESHASAVGVVIEGLPAGEAIDEEQIMQFMRRRRRGALREKRRTSLNFCAVCSAAEQRARRSAR